MVKIDFAGVLYGWLGRSSENFLVEDLEAFGVLGSTSRLDSRRNLLENPSSQLQLQVPHGSRWKGRIGIALEPLQLKKCLVIPQSSIIIIKIDREEIFFYILYELLIYNEI